MFDLVIISLAIPILSPVMLFVSIAILIFDPGSLLFKQTRVGRQGHPFTLYKFRSMPVNTVNLPSDQIGQIKITWVGWFIRRTNLDELPQIFNILLGQMSIVGPRPSLLQQKDLIALRSTNGSLNCLPGLTGLAQIHSFDNMKPEEKASLDEEYVREITFIGDIQIILKTFLYLIKIPPVY